MPVYASLFLTSCQEDAFVATQRITEKCSVENTDAGALITCPDGTSVLMPYPQVDSCEQERINEHCLQIKCGDDSDIICDGEDGRDGRDGVNGQDGINGQDGEDGQSCSVSHNAEGCVVLNCGYEDEIICQDTESSNTNNDCNLIQINTECSLLSCGDTYQEVCADQVNTNDNISESDDYIGYFSFVTNNCVFITNDPVPYGIGLSRATNCEVLNAGFATSNQSAEIDVIKIDISPGCYLMIMDGDHRNRNNGNGVNPCDGPFCSYDSYSVYFVKEDNYKPFSFYYDSSPHTEYPLSPIQFFCTSTNTLTIAAVIDAGDRFHQRLVYPSTLRFNLVRAN